MSKEKVKQQLKSIYDEKGLLGLQYLSNLKSNDPSLYHQVLSSYGRMSHAFQDAFNFSFPIPLRYIRDSAQDAHIFPPHVLQTDLLEN